MRRVLSHTEISALLSCQAKHAFRYTGALTDGDALRPRSTAPMLRDGKAWGAAVAAFHAADPDQLTGVIAAEIRDVLGETLEEDVEKQQELGLYDAEHHRETFEFLEQLLTHYVDQAPKLRLSRLEEEIVVPIPSRTGRRRSSVYSIQAFLDGVHEDEHGLWPVEFKLRKRLSSLEQIAGARQIGWYAWAWREKYGINPAGVIVDEKRKEIPKPVKFNKNGSVSKQQNCTVEAYDEAGGEDPEVRQKLADKKWYRREPVFLTKAEIDDAGRQLVSAAAQLQQFDSGRLLPIRNANNFNCGGCDFREICPHPEDRDLVDVLFERVLPKREREATPV